MELKQISKRLVIAGMVLIAAIKLIIRPLALFDDPTRFFLGIAPNLFASFLVPFGAYWFFSGKNFWLARILRIQSVYDLRLVCIIGLGVLIINEYMQLFPFFGRTFDFYDIIFSMIGLLTSYFFFARMQQRYGVQAS